MGRGHQGHGVRALLLEFDLHRAGEEGWDREWGESGGSPARIQEVKWDWRGVGRWWLVWEKYGSLSPCICHSRLGEESWTQSQTEQSPQEPLAPSDLLHATPPRNEVYGEGALPTSTSRFSHARPSTSSCSQPCSQGPSEEHSPNCHSQILDPSGPLFSHQ